MSFHSLAKLREQPETARAGLKWTEDENDQLMKDVMDGMDFNEVAKKYQRTLIGIKSRVMTNALTMMNDRDLTIQDVAKLVHISEDEIEYFRQTQEYKADATKVKKNVTKKDSPSNNDNIPYQDFMSVLTEIRDYLKIIADK